MTTHERVGYNQNPEDRLAELLPLIAEDFMPQEGYSLELPHVTLSELEPGIDYRQAFQTLFEVPLTDDASFSYAYDSQTGKIGLSSVRFGLAHPHMDGERIQADSLYVQKCEAGFVRIYGLGDEVFAAGTDASYLLDTELSYFQTLLSLTGMLELGDGNNPASTANALGRGDHWYLTESLTVPLTSKYPDRLNEMVITRTRSMVPKSPNLEDIPDTELQYIDPEAFALEHESVEPAPTYTEDYVLTIRSISPHSLDENMRHVEEVSLTMQHDVRSDVRSYILSEMDYTRYSDPFAKNDVKIDVIKEEAYPPDMSDLAYFSQILDRQYSDAS